MTDRRRRLTHDRRGSIMPIGAVALVVLAGLAGGGVDISRAYITQNRLQSACDAGVLAGRKAVGSAGYNASAKAQADAFFDTNFDKDEQGVASVTFNSSSSNNGNTVAGTASSGRTTWSRSTA